MKKSPNFTARIESPDFRFERGDWLKCSRIKISIDVAGKNRVGRVSGAILECAPMANGKLEIRIWVGEKYFRRQFTVFDGLIDWSAIDGRSVSSEDKQRDKARREEARSLLKKKTRKRVLRVRATEVLSAGVKANTSVEHGKENKETTWPLLDVQNKCANR